MLYLGIDQHARPRSLKGETLLIQRARGGNFPLNIEFRYSRDDKRFYGSDALAKYVLF